MSQLSHPNIVSAYDADQVDGTHFLAMEYVEGTDLRRLVKESGPLSVYHACDYMYQAALGLQHAFERGLVHRDIKPSNLVLTRPPPSASAPNPSPEGEGQWKGKRETSGAVSVAAAKEFR